MAPLRLPDVDPLDHLFASPIPLGVKIVYRALWRMAREQEAEFIATLTDIAVLCGGQDRRTIAEHLRRAADLRLIDVQPANPRAGVYRFTIYQPRPDLNPSGTTARNIPVQQWLPIVTAAGTATNNTAGTAASKSVIALGGDAEDDCVRAPGDTVGEEFVTAPGLAGEEVVTAPGLQAGEDVAARHSRSSPRPILRGESCARNPGRLQNAPGDLAQETPAGFFAQETGSGSSACARVFRAKNPAGDFAQETGSPGIAPARARFLTDLTDDDDERRKEDPFVVVVSQSAMEGARAEANRIKQRLAPGAKLPRRTRRLVMGACLAVQAGAMPERWLAEAVEATAAKVDRHQVANAWGYLHTCLVNGCAESAFLCTPAESPACFCRLMAAMQPHVIAYETGRATHDG